MGRFLRDMVTHGVNEFLRILWFGLFISNLVGLNIRFFKMKVI